MNVVHIATYLNGGAGTSAYRIHLSLLKSSGVNSYFISTDPDKNRCAQAASVLPKKDFGMFKRGLKKIRRIGAGNFGIKCFDRHNFLKSRVDNNRTKLDFEVASLPFSDYDLLSHPSVKNADIIHLHWVAGLIDYSTFFKKVTQPVIWTCHDLNPFLGLFHYRGDEQRNGPFIGKIDKEVIAIKKRALRQCKTRLQFVCPSNWLQRELVKSEFLPNVEPVIIPYAVDLDVFKPKEARATRECFGIPAHHTVFLFVSQTVTNYRKGFDLLKNALEKLDPKDVSLLVVGYAPEANNFELNTVYLGSVNDDVLLSQYYSMADAIIIPSREDNLPNVMLESLACGTPVISYDIGGMKDVVIEEVNGVKAKEVSSSSLTEAIERFLKIKDVFNRQKISNLAIENFNGAKIATAYTRLYKTALTK